MNTIQSLSFFGFNVLWMGWNTLLAIVPIVLARTLHKSTSKFWQPLLFVVWLVFLPNTLYMITDVIHLFNPRFGQMTMLFKLLGVVLYLFVFGIAVGTFVLATRPVLQRYRLWLVGLKRKHQLLLFSLLSLLVGFAIGMGRFKRTNTWYLFTQPLRVVQDILSSFTDPTVLFLAAFYALGAFVILVITNNKIVSRR